MVPEKAICRSLTVLQNLSSECNLPAQIESVQGKIGLMITNAVSER